MPMKHEFGMYGFRIGKEMAEKRSLPRLSDIRLPSWGILSGTSVIINF